MRRTLGILCIVIAACGTTTVTDAGSGTDGALSDSGGCQPMAGSTCQNPDMTCDAPMCVNGTFKCGPNQTMIPLVAGSCSGKDSSVDTGTSD
jgi:hypothetical protein